MQKTEHYALNLYEASDNFLRTNFNADNELLDELLLTKAEFVTGTYTGTGSTAQTIDLGFRPKAVFIMSPKYGYESGDTQATPGARVGFIVDGFSYSYNGTTMFTITDTGFQVCNAYYSSTYLCTPVTNSGKYAYIAFR